VKDETLNSDEKPKKGQLWMIRKCFAAFPCVALFLALGKGQYVGTAIVEVISDKGLKEPKVVARIPQGRLLHRVQ